MSAYMVVQATVTKPEQFAEYAQRIPAEDLAGARVQRKIGISLKPRQLFDIHQTPPGHVTGKRHRRPGKQRFPCD